MLESAFDNARWFIQRSSSAMVFDVGKVRVMFDHVLDDHYKEARRIIREIDESSITDEQWGEAMTRYGLDLDSVIRPELKQSPGGGTEGD